MVLRELQDVLVAIGVIVINQANELAWEDEDGTI